MKRRKGELMQRSTLNTQRSTSNGAQEIVLANDPFGAFWRPLNKLAAATTVKSDEERSQPKAATPVGAADIVTTPDPYEMNGSAAVIPIVGPLSKYPNDFDRYCGWCFTLEIQAAICKALDDNAVETILLFIDSPGGMVAGTPDLGDFLAQAKSRKPIVAYVSDLCASGAYWLASQCSAIVANESAFIGSIGVYSVLVDQSKAAEQFGVTLKLVSDGEFKGLTEPGLPIGDKAIQETQRIVGSIANLFRSAVGRGRNLEPSVVSQLADGRVHVASEGLQLGLIDGIGTLDAAIQFGPSTGSGQGEQNMSTPAMNAGNKPNTVRTKAASDGTDGASGGDGSTPDATELCGKILDAVNALSEYMKKALPVDDGKGKSDDGSSSPDDAAAKAVAGDRARLKAISDACPGRPEFAMAQFVAGKSPVEAQAALSIVLAAELKTAQQKIASEEDGAKPIAGAQPAGGGVQSLAEEADLSDPEKVWVANENKIQAAYRGRKDRFLVAWRHGVTPAQIAPKKTAAA